MLVRVMRSQYSPLSHRGRGGIPHQKAVRLPSPLVGEGLGVGFRRQSKDFACTLDNHAGVTPLLQ